MTKEIKMHLQTPSKSFHTTQKSADLVYLLSRGNIGMMKHKAGKGQHRCHTISSFFVLCQRAQ
jgi:hypothetical protein